MRRKLKIRQESKIRCAEPPRMLESESISSQTDVSAPASSRNFFFNIYLIVVLSSEEVKGRFVRAVRRLKLVPEPEAPMLFQVQPRHFLSEGVPVLTHQTEARAWGELELCEEGRRH